MIASNNINQVLLPISFRLKIERALWQSLLDSHSEVTKVRDAWAMQLRYLLEQAEIANANFPSQRADDFLSAINGVTDMLNAAVTKQTVEGMKGKSFLRT